MGTSLGNCGLFHYRSGGSIWIIPAEHNTLESVRLLNDRTRNLPSLNLQKIDEAVDGVGDVAVNQRIVA